MTFLGWLSDPVKGQVASNEWIKRSLLNRRAYIYIYNGLSPFPGTVANEGLYGVYMDPLIKVDFKNNKLVEHAFFVQG